MPPRSPKTVLVGGIIALALIGAGALVFLFSQKAPVVEEVPSVAATSTVETIGTSVEGRSIQAYTYGTGEIRLAFVGGIHGGYEWNSVLLAYELMDYLAENPSVIPPNISVTVIPDANPDGTFTVVGKEGRFEATDVAPGDHSLGRFNANKVDLNRNFDCKWQPEAVWRGNSVSAGTAAFSEPEAKALREFFTRERPRAAVFYHSQANAVYASECENGILPETLTVMTSYAKAAGYPSVSSFDAYPVTGDIEGWLASIGIPAITVELSNHESIEWAKNRLGVEALFAQYGFKN